jgi:hypothetical protein
VNDFFIIDVDIHIKDDRECKRVIVKLDDLGFVYDKDYTCLYGKGWALTGVRLMTREAVRAFTNTDVSGEMGRSAAEIDALVDQIDEGDWVPLTVNNS